MKLSCVWNHIKHVVFRRFCDSSTAENIALPNKTLFRCLFVQHQVKRNEDKKKHTKNGPIYLSKNLFWAECIRCSWHLKIAFSHFHIVVCCLVCCDSAFILFFVITLASNGGTFVNTWISFVFCCSLSSCYLDSIMLYWFLENVQKDLAGKRLRKSHILFQAMKNLPNIRWKHQFFASRHFHSSTSDLKRHQHYKKVLFHTRQPGTFVIAIFIFCSCFILRIEVYFLQRLFDIKSLLYSFQL